MDETVFSDYLIFKEEIKMEFKSFVKKALMTVLTLAVCIPVILKVASVNASEGAYVDVQIQFLKDGQEITSAEPGDKVTVKVATTPRYADGTPINLTDEDMFSFQLDIWGAVDKPVSVYLDKQTNYEAEVTLTVCSSEGSFPECMIQSGLAYLNTSVSGNDPVHEMLEFSGSKKLTMTVTPPSGDSVNGGSSSSGDSSSSGGDSGSSGSDSGSSGGSSGSSDSAPAAGGGAVAPAGGGAGGNAGTATVGGVYTATSMNSVAITSPTATVAAAAGLSEADVAAGTNVRSYICDSRNREMKDALKAVADANGRRIVAYIDVDLYTITKAGVVTNIRNTIAPVTITFGLPGSLANAGHTYSVLCMNPDGTPVIFEDIDANNATVTINATAFGTYAIMINQ